jgi:AraC family transcriptional regulator
MEHSIINHPATLLVGNQQTMSLAHDQTFALWSTFAPRIKEIKNRANKDRFSLKIFPFSPGLSGLTPTTLFQKWAAVPVTDFSDVPEAMQTLIIPQGLYAVFNHKGNAEVFGKTLETIFTHWLPASGYHLADRPHFEILAENYKVSDPESEETIWIPIQPK